MPQHHPDNDAGKRARDLTDRKVRSLDEGGKKKKKRKKQKAKSTKQKERYQTPKVCAPLKSEKETTKIF